MLTLTGLNYFTMKSFTTFGKGEDVICSNEIVYYLSGIAKFMPRAILDLRGLRSRSSWSNPNSVLPKTINELKVLSLCMNWK